MDKFYFTKEQIKTIIETVEMYGFEKGSRTFNLIARDIVNEIDNYITINNLEKENIDLSDILFSKLNIVDIMKKHF